MSWTTWTISDFLKQEKRTDVVFLGSSLMLVPMGGVEADYLGERIDGSQHHRFCYFDDKFREKTGLELRSFNFALPGEMPSDAYLIVKNLLNGNRKPELIVYGVGPRDFLDNILPSPSATDPYRYLSRFGDIAPVAERMMPGWMQRLDFELGKTSYFYGRRAEITQCADFAARSILNALLPIPANSKPMDFDNRRLLLPEYRPWEILAGQAWFRPTLRTERGNFVDNLDEYRKRYGKMKWDTYISQMRFFADTLNESNKKGIKVVVAIMPITELNRSLLSNLSWNAYRSGVIALAKRKGATVVDFSESREFTLSDFGDTVHLHSAGGKHFFDSLMARMAKDKAVLTALHGTGSRLAARSKSL